MQIQYDYFAYGNPGTTAKAANAAQGNTSASLTPAGTAMTAVGSTANKASATMLVSGSVQNTPAVQTTMSAGGNNATSNTKQASTASVKANSVIGGRTIKVSLASRVVNTANTAGFDYYQYDCICTDFCTL